MGLVADLVCNIREAGVQAFVDQELHEKLGGLAEEAVLLILGVFSGKMKRRPDMIFCQCRIIIRANNLLGGGPPFEKFKNDNPKAFYDGFAFWNGPRFPDFGRNTGDRRRPALHRQIDGRVRRA